jgi:hypothetical protein
MSSGARIVTVFSSSIIVLEPQHISRTTFLRGSPEELLRELRFQKKTGTVEISMNQGSPGIIKWTEKERVGWMSGSTKSKS